MRTPARSALTASPRVLEIAQGHYAQSVKIAHCAVHRVSAEQPGILCAYWVYWEKAQVIQRAMRSGISKAHGSLDAPAFFSKLLSRFFFFAVTQKEKAYIKRFEKR